MLRDRKRASMWEKKHYRFHLHMVVWCNDSEKSDYFLYRFIPKGFYYFTKRSVTDSKTGLKWLYWDLEIF